MSATGTFPESVAVWHNLPSGGGLRAMVSHIRALEAHGCRVELFAPPSADNRFFAGLEHLPRHTVARAPAGTYWRRDPSGPYRRRVAAVASMEEHGRQVAAQIDAGGFDLLFANACQEFRASPVAAFSATPSALYLGEPFRWFYEALPELPWLRSFKGTVRNPVRRSFESAYFVSSFLADRHQALAERRWATAHDVILVNSQFSRESVMRAYGSDSRVCYPGTDVGFTGEHEPDRNTVEPYVLCIGAFIHEKRPSFVVDAVAASSTTDRLVWVANVVTKQLVTEVTEQARRLGVRLELEIGVPDARVQQHLRDASVLAYAPLLEPFGLVPLEAMSAGLPVVAVAEGGVRETVVDGVSGLLCPLDPVAMAAAIDEVVRDPELRARLGTSARGWVQSRFTDELAGERLLAEFSRVLAGSVEP